MTDDLTDEEKLNIVREIHEVVECMRETDAAKNVSKILSSARITRTKSFEAKPKRLH